MMMPDVNLRQNLRNNEGKKEARGNFSKKAIKLFLPLSLTGGKNVLSLSSSSSLCDTAEWPTNDMHTQEEGRREDIFFFPACISDTEETFLSLQIEMKGKFLGCHGPRRRRRD